MKTPNLARFHLFGDYFFPNSPNVYQDGHYGVILKYVDFRPVFFNSVLLEEVQRSQLTLLLLNTVRKQQI